MDKVLKQTIEQLGADWRERLTKQDIVVEGLIERLARVEIQNDRPPFGATGNGPNIPDSFRHFLKTGETPEAIKGLSVGTDADGGYGVPEQVDRTIDSVLLDASPMRRICNVVRTQTSDYKRLINIRGTAGGWVGESDARPQTTNPQLAEITFPTGELYANPASTQWALDDISFDVEGWLQTEIADVFAQMEGAAFISGSGTKQPKGFLSVTLSTDADDVRAFGSIQYSNTAGSGALVADDLFVGLHSLKPAYRQNATWVFNDSTLETIRKLKDTTNQYLFRAGLLSGEPDVLLGYPILIASDMPDIAAAANSIAFGDFKRGYTIVDRLTRMLRDPYTDKPNVSFYATKRVSGMVTNSEAIKILKIKA